jgi:hypothetical protein
VLAAAIAASQMASESPPAHAAAVYNLAGRPQAQFVWFPSSPHPGETVLLGSISTDLTSPLVGYAWDLGLGGGFVGGGPTLYTRFATYAPHVVRLRVTNGSGVSDVATHTIHMSAPPASVLQPFPLVRIVGLLTRSGVKVKLLAVRVGGGATSTVTCRGRACPVRSARRAVAAARRGAVWITFHSFERYLPAGTVLEIRVAKPGKIGSYTRFTIRRHRLPARQDACLEPSGTAPMACPAA